MIKIDPVPFFATWWNVGHGIFGQLKFQIIQMIYILNLFVCTFSSTALKLSQPNGSIVKDTYSPNTFVTLEQKSKKVTSREPLSAPCTDKNHSLEVGDRVSTPKSGNGTLRYKGEVNTWAGNWAGVKLDEPKGRNNGSTGGKRYGIVFHQSNTIPSQIIFLPKMSQLMRLIIIMVLIT